LIGVIGINLSTMKYNLMPRPEGRKRT